MLKSRGSYGRLFYFAFAIFCMVTGALAGPNTVGVVIGSGGALMVILWFIFRKEAPRG